MKRLVISSLLIICVAALVVSLGTFAYFSDSASSTGNTFSAGTLYINDGSHTFTITPDSPWGNMAPGQTRTGSFTITNNGTIAMGSLAVSTTNGGFLFTYDSNHATSSASCPASSLAAGASTTCTLTVSLPEPGYADNTYQNKSGTVDVVVTGTQ